MTKKHTPLSPDAPLLHADHGRPVTRRDFLGYGLTSGLGMVMGPTLLGLFANPREARAAALECTIPGTGAGKIPFICFDLAGGASIAGSNVLVGRQGGQLDFLTTAGYSKLGLPGDMIPQLTNVATGAPFYNVELGLAFHSESALLRGIREKTDSSTRDRINGAVIPARSENDTANNPHNPMYGINAAGANGRLLTLIGSRNSDSGGNSVASIPVINSGLNPLFNPAVRPTKIDRPSDSSGLVDTGKLVGTDKRAGLLSQEDAVAVLEAMEKISADKLTQVTTDAVVKELVNCGYTKAADLVRKFGNPADLDPSQDNKIVGPGGIFTQTEFEGDGEFRKTASVMKLVIDGNAGAGTIEMGGFDYHTGERGTGELRDLRAGRCIGACLEYAARFGKPLMIYVFSDGSLTSNGMIDDSVNGGGKGVWTGDNSDVAASFFLVYNPNGKPVLLGGSDDQKARHQQIGWFRPDASVETSATPAGNNVNLLVETVILNYMALHGEQGNFAGLFPKHGLGNATMRDNLTAFTPIVNGKI